MYNPPGELEKISNLFRKTTLEGLWYYRYRTLPVYDQTKRRRLYKIFLKFWFKNTNALYTIVNYGFAIQMNIFPLKKGNASRWICIVKLIAQWK